VSRPFHDIAQKFWNRNPRSGVLPSDCRSEDGEMRNFSRGIWTCAAVYVAIGLAGIFFFMSERGVATSSEGYGIAAIAAPVSPR
jgi:hypothetical protein